MPRNPGFSVTKETRSALSRRVSLSLWKRMKNRVLGESYVLSIAFVSDRSMRALNKKHRNKDTTTDILSFALSQEAGEIIVSISEALKRAEPFGMNGNDYLPFLFIHGMLHLKGHDHGSRMEALERKFCREFGIVRP